MTRGEKLIKSKLGLLELGEYLQNVSEACRVMGYSRDTFYRVKEAYETGGVEALQDESRRKPNRKNRASEETESAVQEEFDRVAFRKRLYRTIEELQVDLDAWLVRYTTERTNQGKHRKGRTP